MSLCDVVDELLDEHSLADTSTAEETNFATTSVGREKVDNLDTGLKNLSSGRLVNKWRRLGMDGAKLDTIDWTALVDGFADDVHDTAEGCGTDRNTDGGASVDDLLPTDETFGTVHGNGADRVLAKMGGNLEDETTTVEVLNLKGIENLGEVFSVELDVNDSTDDGLDVTNRAGCLRRIRAG